jgi:hypothetical protein
MTSKVPLMMLAAIPSGYYAVRPDTETPYVFMRLARPVHGKRKGWVKVQTQHGETLYDRWLWNPGNLDPSTNVIRLTWNKSTLPGNQSIEDLILLMIVDHRAAAREYAREIGNCHRCNKDLTDERSRWYGFGPECEKSLEGEKDEIDDENGGTYEELKMRGLI